MALAPRAGPPPALPVELHAARRQTARELDMDRSTALIEKVRVFDPVYAGNLGLRAAQFDYDSLVAVLPTPSESRSK